VLGSKLFDHIFAECGCDYRKYNPELNEYKVVEEKILDHTSCSNKLMC
jgi:hypothetical protein